MYGLVRGVANRTTPIMKVAVTSKATVMAGPPRVPISFTEKLISGVIMAFAITAPSAYILANVQNYRKR
jgi:hypothetical protein